MNASAWEGKVGRRAEDKKEVLEGVSSPCSPRPDSSGTEPCQLPDPSTQTEHGPAFWLLPLRGPAGCGTPEWWFEERSQGLADTTSAGPCPPAPGLAVEVTVPPEPLSAPLGGTAELGCTYRTSVGDNFALEWSFVPPGRPLSETQPILYFTNGRLYPTGSKGKRASLLQSPPTRGVATLKLSSVQPSDTGTFLCHVNNPPDFDTNGLGMINLTVLVPPSRPSCRRTGDISVGGAAALMCSSSEGAPKPVYNWIRLGSAPASPQGSMVQDEVSGQLILSNLSLASSGTYRCVATNQLGSASCELALSVTDPSTGGRVAGAVIGVLLVVLFLSITVFCLIRVQKERRKRPQETYVGSDLREDAVAPGISEPAPAKPDPSSGLLERRLSTSTLTSTKSKLAMVV
ncbi:V-set and immunoglobulin domain-containing protein 2 [Suncus etruscus]|uniref:V-set and immunoglobulin domain-containing protein 2 n=1 Tax=Suncus etruscus TaxID=109475 RepID=UPI002110DA41|nr:V-set and immunoglobulin domain-containing protein 2 [Suncus etruscus]